MVDLALNGDLLEVRTVMNIDLHNYTTRCEHYQLFLEYIYIYKLY